MDGARTCCDGRERRLGLLIVPSSHVAQSDNDRSDERAFEADLFFPARRSNKTSTAPSAPPLSSVVALRPATDDSRRAHST